MKNDFLTIMNFCKKNELCVNTKNRRILEKINLEDDNEVTRAIEIINNADSLIYPDDENQLNEIVNYEVATHEEKLEYLQEKFVVGEVIDWYCIGDYQISEYVRDGEIRYHVYINYEDTCRSYSTLDGAIIGAISQKYDRCTTRADRYICKMLDIEL